MRISLLVPKENKINPNIFSNILYRGDLYNYELVDKCTLKLNNKNFRLAARLPVNGVQPHSHAHKHAKIYLGVLWSLVQNFIWRVNHTLTFQRVFSVILLEIIHLQLRTKFLCEDIHCIIYSI